MCVHMHAYVLPYMQTCIHTHAHCTHNWEKYGCDEHRLFWVAYLLASPVPYEGRERLHELQLAVGPPPS